MSNKSEWEKKVILDLIAEITIIRPIVGFKSQVQINPSSSNEVSYFAYTLYDEDIQRPFIETMNTLRAILSVLKHEVVV